MDIETPVPGAPAAAESPAPETPAEPTLAEHEAQFSPKSPADADPDAESAGERDAGGRFKPRHRAKSQQASPADVPRIAELTKKLREAEAERDALRRPSAPSVPRPAAPPAAQAPAPAPPQTAPRLQAFIDQLAPSEDYNVAVERHAEAMAQWTVARHEQQRQQQHAEREFAQTFKQKVEAAAAKYPDYVQVALEAPSSIPQGSILDRWIWEHKTGADVLYHFQKHPEQVSQLLALPVLDQVETLALLAQRFAAPRVPDAVTGSPATPPVPSAPRPPNPVRTGPLRGSEEPPGESASLREHEQYYYGSNRRRA